MKKSAMERLTNKPRVAKRVRKRKAKNAADSSGDVFSVRDVVREAISKPRMLDNPYGSEDAVVFKHEGLQRGMAIGPVWIRRAGVLTNFRNGEPAFGGGFFPAWYSYANAQRIAVMFDLPFAEV